MTTQQLNCERGVAHIRYCAARASGSPRDPSDWLARVRYLVLKLEEELGQAPFEFEDVDHDALAAGLRALKAGAVRELTRRARELARPPKVPARGRGRPRTGLSPTPVERLVADLRGIFERHQISGSFCDFVLEFAREYDIKISSQTVARYGRAP